jgi:hypothetical protein
MKKFFLLIIILLLSSCVIKKELKITIMDTEGAPSEIRAYITGSELEDIKPELELPLIP